MELKINLNLKCDIIPIYENIGKGKKKEKVCTKVRYFIYFCDFTILQGEINKNDIEVKIPQIESYNIDFYGFLRQTIINEIITYYSNNFGVDIDTEAFYFEYEEFFNEFMEGLKNNVNKLIQ